MQKDIKPVNLRLTLVLGTAVLLLIIQVLGLFSNITTPIERLEYSMQDTFVRLRGTEELSGEIVIVAIDDQSFSWTGLQWPWPRSYFAEIVD
ncbi:MAG: CHASE2 domain-containing protein, partial [Chloroflexi bacterium]|nr:CHASE2 domain-containing protein [Chloroflexota bacterium]